MAKKQVAVILSGCGVYDGSEIHEAVLTLLALEQEGAQVQCFAPDIDQLHVINHLRGVVSEGKRNVLVESARIARGAVKDLAKFSADDYDALAMPGGFGAAKNLSNYALAGAKCSVQEDVEKAVLAMHAAGKPIGALCISPEILAKLIPGAQVTLGADGEDAKAAVAMGAVHTVTTHAELVIDQERRLVTSPCYQLEANIAQVAQGARKMVEAMLAMA